MDKQAAPAAAPGYEDRVVPDEEKAVVSKVKDEIDRALDACKTRFKSFELNRSYYRGAATNGGKERVRTNLIFSTIATLYPQIYAKNPDISFSPAESVSEDSYDATKKFGKTAETIVSRMLVRDAKLKKKVKAQVRAAMLCEVGWLKVTYQKDVREDPEIRSRMNDVQDDIERLRASTVMLDEAGADRDLKIGELQLQLQGLAQSEEMLVSSGLVVDKLMSEDVLILDPTIRDFDDYTNASRIAQRVWMDEARFEQRFKRKPCKSAATWKSADVPKTEQTQSTSTGKGESSFVCVWEIWDKDTQQLYTWCQGEEGWARNPFKPRTVGRRFYPFFGLCFNPVDGQFYGVSDVELLVKLQEEYNETREKFSEHRKYSMPITVVRAGGSLTKDDIALLKKAKPGDTVVISGDSSVPLKNDIDALAGPPIDPALYDVQMIRADIEMVSGASDAARGMVLQAKTATEAEIMQQGLVSRTAERQDTIEDMIEEMAAYAIEVLVGELEIPEVTRLAGTEAVWPLNKDVDSIFNQLNLEIRAGSTGKPNKNAERDSWVQLLPQLQAAMEKVMALRQAGQNDMADAMLELTRESLRRFDERIDIDSFLPRKKKGEIDPAQMTMDLQAKTAQLQQAGQIIQELQAQLAQAQQAQQAKTSELDFKANEAQKDRALQKEIEDMRINAKAAQDGVAQALQVNQEIVSRVQQIESFLKSMPAPKEGEEGSDADEILQGVQQMLAQMAPPQAAQPIQVTVPVTIDGKGVVVKEGRAVPNPDGSYSMQVVETPGGAQ